MSYREALAWLYATQTFGIKLGLEQTQRLLLALDLVSMLAVPPGSARASRASFGASPKRSFSPRVIHVAGTNGKGSVCAMADAILRAAGYRGGLFTSPHLVSFRERILIDGEMIAESDVAQQLTQIRNLVEEWEPMPTFFEIVTALALLDFRRQQCDVVVLETGMGGRLDATNAARSDVSVITPVGLDHQKWLGNTIAEIAREKAGIIKPGVPVVSAPQPEGAAVTIRERARELDAPLQVVNEPWTHSELALLGSHQRMNAAVAVAAVRALLPDVSEEAIETGLAKVAWPARFQIFDERTIIDGGHNPAGATVLSQAWHDRFGADRATVVLALLNDKDAAAIISALSPLAARFILSPMRSVRALPPAELAFHIPPSISFTFAQNFQEAFFAARQFPERILITGSLHFAGEALAFLEGRPAAYEECAQ